jgi:chromosome segregation ATPase
VSNVDSATKTPYEKIMAALAKKKSTTGDLEDKLSRLEKQYQTERDRAYDLQSAYNESDQNVIDLTDSNKQVRDSVDYLTHKLVKEQKKANIARKRVKALENELERQKQTTAKAQLEAKMAKEQIDEIWKAMQSGGDGGKGKSKAEHEDVGEQAKKAKTENSAK